MKIMRSGLMVTWKHDITCICKANLQIGGNDLSHQKKEHLDPIFWVNCPECGSEIEIPRTNIPEEIVSVLLRNEHPW